MSWKNQQSKAEAYNGHTAGLTRLHAGIIRKLVERGQRLPPNAVECLTIAVADLKEALRINGKEV